MPVEIEIKRPVKPICFILMNIITVERIARESEKDVKFMLSSLTFLLSNSLKEKKRLRRESPSPVAMINLSTISDKFV